jgi:5-methylcytosine-specific restriction enzyme A
MPNRAPHYCNWSNCTVIVSTRYCDTHTAELERRKSQDNTRRQQQQTNKDDKRFYASKFWQYARRQQLADEPFCEAMVYDGRCNAVASHVDHRVARASGGSDLDSANLRSLCVSCHSRKTAAQDGGFGNARKDEQKTITPHQPALRFLHPSTGKIEGSQSDVVAGERGVKNLESPPAGTRAGSFAHVREIHRGGFTA